MAEMVEIDGWRYRMEDAVRLGLMPAPAPEPETPEPAEPAKAKKAPAPKNKARTSVPNKVQREG